MINEGYTVVRQDDLNWLIVARPREGSRYFGVELIIKVRIPMSYPMEEP